MLRSGGAWLLALISLVIGCTNSERTTMLPGSATISPAPGTLNALSTAGPEHYSKSITGTLSTGDVFIFGEWLDGTWIENEGTNMVLSLEYLSYIEPVKGFGWKVIDEFLNPSVGLSLTLTYGTSDSDTPPDRLNLWSAAIGYMLSTEKGYMKASAGCGNADDAELYSATVSYKYYIMDNFSMGAEWIHEYAAGGTLNHNRYKVNFNYLAKGTNPILFKVYVGRQVDEEGPYEALRVGTSLDWVISSKLLAGLSWDRLSSENNLLDFSKTVVGGTVGYCFTPLSTVTIGYTSVSTHNWYAWSDSYNGFNIGYSQRF